VALLQVEEYAAAARGLLAEDVWGFIEGGSGAEATLAANRAAYERVLLRPRVLVDVSRCATGITLLGAPMTMPVGIAPMAYHRLVHPDGELATAAAAGEAGVLLVVSMFSSATIEEVATAAAGPLWMQVYWLRRREVVAEVVGRAEAAGIGALVLTVDAPRVARRLRDARAGFALPPHARAVNVDPAVMATSHGAEAGSSAVQRHSLEQFDPSITWADLPWLRERTALPIVLKGIAHPDDARLAVDDGADAIIVSNHGGRQLDTMPAAIELLPPIAAAVGGRVPLLLDGGIRRGTDVAKALALGAVAVAVGRPVLWGLAVAGAHGVLQVLQTLQSELDSTLALCGCGSPADVTRDLVRLSGTVPGW